MYKVSNVSPKDKNTEIVIYCGGFFCHKSHHLAEYLVADGYKNVKVLAGGMPAWKKGLRLLE
ncbi:rhodanese-like domain-containing protein [Anaerobacillus sp. HL2]|nr:rhodanese-like domain-containing protein [Anaerobacillus sp. HL2]